MKRIMEAKCTSHVFVCFNNINTSERDMVSPVGREGMLISRKGTLL